MYHYIRDYNNYNDRVGINLSVSPENFENQLKWLHDHNYQTINLDDLIDPDKKTLSKISTSGANLKPIILTFDDGYIDAFTNAFPILKRYRFTGTFYITSDFIGRENYLNWRIIKKMNQSGMKFGGHTTSHPDLTIINDDQLSKEIIDNKKMIEEQLNNSHSESCNCHSGSQRGEESHQILHFCYPAGKYNDRVMNKIKEAGYKTATTTNYGISDQNSNLYELPRIRMTNETDLSRILE